MAKENNIELEAKAIDAEEAVSEAKELSDDDLEDVSGGLRSRGKLIVTAFKFCSDQ